MWNRGNAGFSLSEVAIVVAILVLLVTLSVPKFMIAQLRAKVALCYSDMSYIAEALAVYRLERGAYPPWRISRVPGYQNDYMHPNIIRYYRLTTPVAYLDEIPQDPFVSYEKENDYEQWGTAYDYVEVTTPGQETDPHAWGHLFRLNSWGPDEYNSYAGGRDFGSFEEACPGGSPRFVFAVSNGLMSYGDILWVGPKGGPFLENYCPIENQD